MSALKFISEIVSRHSVILLTNNHQPISAQVAVFLKSRPDIKLVEIADANTGIFSDDPIQVVVHFAGFGKPSLAQSLYHTSSLHRLMDYSLRKHAKFVLVLPDVPTPQQQTAIDLTHQFGKNFSLNYTLITVPGNSEIHQAAQAIIRSFIHDFKLAPPLAPTPTVSLFPARPKTLAKKYDLFALKIFGMAFLFLFIPWLVFLAGLSLTAIALRCGKANLQSGNWAMAQTCGRATNDTAVVLRGEAFWVLGSNSVIRLSGVSLPDFFISLSRLGQNIQALGHAGDLATTGKLVDLSESLPRTLEQLAYSQADLQKMPHTQGLVAELAELRTFMAKANLVLPGIKEIVAAPRQTWLVLLQDADELRPTGGFIDNFALASLENGQITDIQIYDTESTDGLLRGHVDPPVDLAKLTHQDNWYLRDSNWDPDFPSSAARAAWFVNKELGQSVDGVVGVNSHLEQHLAQILSVNTNSDSKTLSTNLITKLKSMTTSEQRQVVSFLLQQLENRQMTITSLGNSVPLNVVAWDGGISCCDKDSVYVVDSNVGINKVNSQIKPVYKLNVSKNNSTMRYDFELSYTNSSPSAAWPLGDYANYVRVMVPAAFQFDQASFDGKTIARAEVIQSNEAGFVTWGILVNIPVGQAKILKLAAHRNISGTTNAQYQLRWLNQPGQMPIPLTIASSAQIGYNAVLSSPIDVTLKLN